MTDTRAEEAAQRFYDDSTLRDELTDDEAKVLIEWGKAQIGMLSSQLADDEAFEEACERLFQMTREINRYAGQQAYMELADREATLEDIETHASALGFTVQPQTFTAFAISEPAAVLTDLLGRITPEPAASAQAESADTAQPMIRISARISNQMGSHRVTLQTNDRTHTLTIPPKDVGAGSSANGGELLFLALATCYANDIYREAGRRGITVSSVHVEVNGEFDPTPGSCAENITYQATVAAEAGEDIILDLMRYTDTVAEIQNTLRRGTSVTLTAMRAIPMS